MASDYHRGDMDIHEQVSTYHLFMMLTKWGSLGTAALMIFLVLLFCTKTGFIGSLAVGVVVAVIGVFSLREKGDAH